MDRPAVASMETVQFTDVAEEVGLDFRHGAFRWGTTGDPNAMMGGGLCWIDVDDDGWLDLFVVNTWSEGEWGRWRQEGALPSTRLFRNDRGRFTDVTDDFGAGLEIRGNGCVAADLDHDGFTDLYVTTERENVLLWNEGGDRFVADDGSAGVATPRLAGRSRGRGHQRRRLARSLRRGIRRPEPPGRRGRQGIPQHVRSRSPTCCS